MIRYVLPPLFCQPTTLIAAQIKDSRRVKRLRDGAKRSLRGKMINAADRATGWIIVSLIGQFWIGPVGITPKADRTKPSIGILTAGMAFVVIKTETLLFGLKDGYCASRVWRTRKHCARDWVSWAADRNGTGTALGMYILVAVSANDAFGKRRDD